MVHWKSPPSFPCFSWKEVVLKDAARSKSIALVCLVESEAATNTYFKSFALKVEAMMLLHSQTRCLGTDCNNFHLLQLVPKYCYFFYVFLPPVFVAISCIACMSHKGLVDLVPVLVFRCSDLNVLFKVLVLIQ